MAPRGTLPKSTAAGLELSTAEELVLDVLAAEARAELPLALVMPVQPERIDNDNQRVTDRRKSRFPEPGQTCRMLEMCCF